MNLFDLTGKTAIVTGGTRGLGHGMAEGLLEAGCRVAVIGTGDSVFERAEEFRERGYFCEGVKADLGCSEERKRAFDECVQKLGGRLDILVTAHGIQRRHPSEEFPMEDWEQVLGVNLTAVLPAGGQSVSLPEEQGQDYNGILHAVILRRLHGSSLCSVERRRRPADEGPWKRVGREGNLCEFPCARIYGDGYEYGAYGS